MATSISSWLKSLFFLTLVALTVACQRTPPVLKVALVAPFEGADRQIGYDAIYAARLAIREINQAGGINGYHVALVSLDDSGQPELATAVAQSLILDPQIIAVVGHGLPQTTATAQQIYQDANLTLIPIISSNPEELSTEFRQAYEAVTPFDEQAGPYADSTYHAFKSVFSAVAASTNPTRAEINKNLTQTP